MGALPKRKISKGRRDRRRTHDSLEATNLSTCPKCGHTTRPHFECSYCGHYKKAVKKTETK
jgi:large subunit ribosomal protein L32